MMRFRFVYRTLGFLVPLGLLVLATPSARGATFTLSKVADSAMYRAKRAGRNRVFLGTSRDLSD